MGREEAERRRCRVCRYGRQRERETEGEVWSKANNLWTNIQTTLSPLLASEKETMRGISYQRVLYPSWPGRDCDPHTPWLSVGRDSADRETEREVKRERDREVKRERDREVKRETETERE
jgi:hypothetical protein